MDHFLQYLTWALFLLVFASASVEAVRHPVRSNVDIALLFLAPALEIFSGIAASMGFVEPGPLPNAINTALLLALPYLLLRLVDDFTGLPPLLMHFGGMGLLSLSVGALALAPPRPFWYNLLAVLYFLGFQLYAAVALARESRRLGGVTRRRIQAAAVASVLLVMAVLVAGLRGWLPGEYGIWNGLFDTLALASGIGYFVGFAPPAWLRIAWQAPELRAFLKKAASLPRLLDTSAMIQELERGAATSLGATGARIGLWDESSQRLEFDHDGKRFGPPPGQAVATRCFLTQQPAFSSNLLRDEPAFAAKAKGYSAMAVLAAPITAGEKPLGVLLAYTPRAPIFALDDLALLRLIADQAAVLLENRALTDEVARARAREEVARLKEDFLSAAAHHLKTPLTVLLAQAQLLDRQARRSPDAPPDQAGIRRLVDEARRMKTLVNGLLDASQIEHGKLIGPRQSTDLAEIVKGVCEGNWSALHHCVVEAEEPVMGEYDRGRIRQVVENLLENAVKYSPQGGEVRVKVWCEEDEARLTVSDSGIGIPSEDLAHVFDRFHRGANVDDRRFAGMGLGLFICRGIVEGHGGRIWAESTPGQGSTFHVALPAPTARRRLAS